MATDVTATNAVWSFGLGGMEEEESEEFGMFQKIEEEVPEPTESTCEDSAELIEEEPSLQSKEEAKDKITTGAVWSFGLGGQEEVGDEDDDDEWGAWGTPVSEGEPVLIQGPPEEEEELPAVVEEEEKVEVPYTPTQSPRENSEGSINFTSLLDSLAPPMSPAQDGSSVFTINEDEEEEDEDANEGSTNEGSAVFTITEDEEVPEEKFVSPIVSPKKPVSSIPDEEANEGSAVFTITEDEEVPEEKLVSPIIASPKKSVSSILGRRPMTVGSLRRPRYGADFDTTSRMTPSTLLSKMTPKSTYKRASALATMQSAKRDGDKTTRSERLLSIQSSFRHLDLLNDSSSSLHLDNSDMGEKDEEADSSAIFSAPPTEKDDFGSSSGRTVETTDLSARSIPESVQEDSESPPLNSNYSSPGRPKKKKDKSKSGKSPKPSKKIKDLKDGETTPSGTRKKKKGLKKLSKLATAPAMTVTDLVRDTSGGVTKAVKSTAKGTKNLVTHTASGAANLVSDAATGAASGTKHLAKGVGEQLGIKKKKKKKDKDSEESTKKKKSRNKAAITAKSLSPMPTRKVGKKKKSRSKLPEVGKELSSVTERPTVERNDSFSSNHSAQSAQSFS